MVVVDRRGYNSSHGCKPTLGRSAAMTAKQKTDDPILFTSRDGPRALACTDTAAHRSVQNSPLRKENDAITEYVTASVLQIARRDGPRVLACTCTFRNKKGQNEIYTKSKNCLPALLACMFSCPRWLNSKHLRRLPKLRIVAFQD